MRHLHTPTQARAGQMVGVAVLLALVAAGALVVRPRTAETLAGIAPAPVVSAPDDLPPATKDDPTAFLVERDLAELRVGEETTLAEFLHRNRLNKPSQRKQIVEQLGSDQPNARIAAGTTFRIRLTPAASDVPGVAPVRR